MAVSKLALGMNARNFSYLRALNSPSAVARADDKLITKQELIKAGVPTVPLISIFKTFPNARSYDWGKLRGEFVLKPAHGYGGDGITVIRRWDGKKGVLLNNEIVTPKELEAEIFGILDGAHSIDNVSDTAFLEERVIVSRSFRRLSAQGVPDIRIIVSNKMPIMAMLRMPTIHSNGKANLHQGALGIGIDIRTGITTRAISFNKSVKRIPGTNVKVRGIKIPLWDQILEIAVKAHRVSKLGYSGIDIVLDEKRGPLVLEVNARPGLQIQLANGASLRTRLERIEGISVPTTSFGVDLAKRMFAEHGLAHIEDAQHILGVFETITVIGPKGSRTIEAKIDTGAYRSSIDHNLATELGLKPTSKERTVKNATGSQLRTLFHATLRIRGTRINTSVSSASRSHMKFPIIIGRKNLKGFLVDPFVIPLNYKKAKTADSNKKR